MTSRAIEKIATLAASAAPRTVVCHRCGFECAVPSDARLHETACLGCVQRLIACGDTRALGAVRAVADWPDKSCAMGPGYAVVACPHCAIHCVVPVGDTARTGCGACLQPLGVQPLIRMDCHVVDGADLDDVALDTAILAREPHEDAWMWLRP